MRSEIRSRSRGIALSVCLITVFSAPAGAIGASDTPIYPSPILGIKAGYQTVTGQNQGADSSGGGLVGAYTGLRFSPRFQWELGYQTHNQFNASGISDRVRSLLYESALRYDWYFQQEMSAYGRFGLAFWDVEASGALGRGDEGLSPLGEIGFHYRINRNAGINVGYQYIDSIGRGGEARYDSFALIAGLVFSFGSEKNGSRHVGEVFQEQDQFSFQLTSATGGAVVQHRCTANGDEVLREGQTLHSIFFRINEQVASLSDYDALAGVIDMLGQQTSLEVELVGYTDSSGSAPYNQHLSQRRAEFVGDILLANGVNATRLHVRGGGVLDEGVVTEQERAQQRRVDINVVASQCI